MHIGTFATSAAKILCWPMSYCLGSDAKEKYHAALDEWEKGGEPGEQRDIAARRLRDACDRETDYVDLRGLGLKTWPPLPTLKMVDISDNALTDVPTRWRPLLEKVVARNNHIKVLPDMPLLQMRYIDFSGNAIRKTGDLTGIRHIDLHDNCLTAAPALTNGTLQVDLRGNSIPDVLDDQIPHGCKIFLSGETLSNVLTRRTLTRYPDLGWEARKKWCGLFRGSEKDDVRQFFEFLEKISKVLKIKAEDLRPELTAWLERAVRCDTVRKEIFARAIDGLATCDDGALLALKHIESALNRDAVRQGESVLPGLSNGDFQRRMKIRRTLPQYAELNWRAREKWYEILRGGEKADAEQFFIFLENLRLAFKMRPEEFRKGVSIWLERLADPKSDTFRAETFALGVSGLGLCRDGALVEFKQMELALIKDDIRHGKFDGKLPELIVLAREAFRSEELRNFSAALGAEQNSEEELEIECRLILGLRKRLGFNTNVRNMHYAATAPLEIQCFNDAEEWVQIAENERFPAWLATWPAWNEAVQRMESGLYEKAEEEWQARLAAWLENSKQETAAGRKTDNDLVVFLETNEMTEKYIQDARMARDAVFAETHGCAEEMKPLWNLKTRKAVRAPMEPEKSLLHMLGTRF